jgi:hypothetical protein
MPVTVGVGVAAEVEVEVEAEAEAVETLTVVMERTEVAEGEAQDEEQAEEVAMSALLLLLPPPPLLPLLLLRPFNTKRAHPPPETVRAATTVASPATLSASARSPGRRAVEVEAEVQVVVLTVEVTRRVRPATRRTVGEAVDVGEVAVVEARRSTLPSKTPNTRSIGSAPASRRQCRPPLPRTIHRRWRSTKRDGSVTSPNSPVRRANKRCSSVAF